jgi:hypothetical protein
VSPEQIRETLDFYDAYLRHVGDGRAWPSETYLPERAQAHTEVRAMQHLRWMSQEAKGFLTEADQLHGLDNAKMVELRSKAMRWLCFIQGVLWTVGAFTINEMRAHNTPPSNPMTEGKD